MVQFEADRRAINITINSFGTDLSKDDRIELYPNFGLLFPEGVAKLEKVDDIEQVKTIVSQYAVPLLHPPSPSFPLFSPLSRLASYSSINCNRRTVP